MDEELETEQLLELSLDIIEAASGRRWWIALRLIGVMMANWHVLGAEMLLRGVDATRLSLSGWLDVALLLAIRNMEPKDVTMFTSQLELPPPEERVEIMEDMEMPRDQFLSIMG